MLKDVRANMLGSQLKKETKNGKNKLYFKKERTKHKSKKLKIKCLKQEIHWMDLTTYWV